MTRDDIIRMAREAGTAPSSPFLGVREADAMALERFAALVAAAEREACAKVCEALIEGADWRLDPAGSSWDECAESCAAAIRARSES